MPSINLRLTQEQHSELERWAHDGYRSIQKEIIFRLFSEGQPAKRTSSGLVLPKAGSDSADLHFKPDPK